VRAAFRETLEISRIWKYPRLLATLEKLECSISGRSLYFKETGSRENIFKQDPE